MKFISIFVLVFFLSFYYVFFFFLFFFFSSRRRHTRYIGDWSSDVCSSDLCLRVQIEMQKSQAALGSHKRTSIRPPVRDRNEVVRGRQLDVDRQGVFQPGDGDRKSTRLNSSHRCISYAVFCLKKKKKNKTK